MNRNGINFQQLKCQNDFDVIPDKVVSKKPDFLNNAFSEPVMVFKLYGCRTVKTLKKILIFDSVFYNRKLVFAFHSFFIKVLPV